MPPTILIVDPDKDFLAAMEQALGGNFDLRTASGGTAARELVRNARGLSLVVANPVLPDMDGVEFLVQTACQLPDVSRVAILDDRDCDILARLINEAGVMGVLFKPVKSKDVAEVLKRALGRHQECVQERHTLQETLRGSVKVLLDLMEVLDPPAVGRSRRVRKRALELGRRLKARSAWQLEMAVMLSHIGCLVLPNEITRKLDDGRDLTPEEQKLFFRHPAIAAKLLSNIKRMDSVAQAVLYQNSKYSKEIPLESRILKAVLDLDRQERKGLQTPEGMQVLKKRSDWYDPDVLAALDDILDPAGAQARELAVEDLVPGLIMARDLKTSDGTVLLLKGQHLTKASTARLKLFAEDLGLAGPVSVVDGKTVDVSAEGEIPQAAQGNGEVPEGQDGAKDVSQEDGKADTGQ